MKEKIQGKKKLPIIGGVFLVFSVIGGILGFVSDGMSVTELFKKDKTDKTNQDIVQVQIVDNQTTQITTTQEVEEIIEIEPPITTTEEITTTPKNPEDFYLHNIEPTQSENFYSDDSKTDTIGNLYTGNVQCVYGNGYAIYYAGGQYTHLSGTIAASDYHFSNDNISTISILVDDEEMYNTGNFSRVSTPMNVDIDITNAQWIKIQHSSTDTPGDTILANFKFVE